MSATAKSWNEGKADCLSKSANLVNIGSEGENLFVNSQINDRNWLGLREVAGNLMNWINDGSEPSYVYWSGGQPVYQDGREDCTYTQSGSWSTEDCARSLKFICEKGRRYASRNNNYEIVRNIFSFCSLSCLPTAKYEVSLLITIVVNCNNPFFTVLQTHDVSQWSSSSWQCMTTPELARLGLKVDCHSSWCGNIGSWLEIDVGRDWSIGILSTQGAADNFGFVKRYKFSYKQSAGSWQDYKEDGESAAKVLSKAAQ